MAGNLTRDEARERARLLTVGSYAVELDLTTGTERFGSTTVIRFGSAEPGASTFVDLHGAVVREATLNGTALDPASYDADKGRLPLPGLAADNELRVVADCAYSRSGEGLHRFVDPVDGGVYLYSQFETADAHRMFTCFDQPDLKATFEFRVRAPEEWEVVTNEAAEKREGGDWHFMPTPQISTYITALIAGPYHVVRDEYRRADGTVVPLGVYCRESLAEHLDAPAIIEVTRQGFEYFERVFGRPYPFAKYDQLFVPEFNAGAMENAGAVTFLEDYVFRSRVTDAAYERRAETILHEMAHMWFGDLVTMRWWDDLWLNESFATYMSVLCQSEATKWTSSWTSFANLMKAWAYRQDQLPSTHPISADIPDIRAVEVNFDGITYAKGASVLKQLVAYVGLDNFLEGVRRYFDRHAWGNTVLADLLSALEETSGREDLGAWSKEWLETAGANTLRPHYEVDQDGNFASFAVLQEAKADYPTLRSHRVAIGLYDRTPEGIVRRERVELDVRGARTEVPELVGRKRPDLVLVNDDDLTYAKIRLDDHSLSTLIDGIGDIREGLPRALCWSAAWDMTRDAEMATRDYVRLVAKGIRGVTDISVAQTLLRQARLAVQQYADPAWRDEGLTLMADTLAGLAREAEAGSDFQLAFVQAFAGSAITDAHLSLVRGLLDGSEKLDGLTVDTDLRWTLLRRLVVTGKAGQDEIDAELERDRTAAGERHAASCTAAIPSADAKAAAWERIVSGDLPNAVYRATLGGFVEPDQADLLVPYADRYFAEVGRVWKEWSSDMSQTFAEVAYPFLVIEQSTIDRTEAYIAENAPPAALVRLLSEGRDGVARALRARAQDASAS
ncbi:aminopeptidase N [Actinomadura sp. WMMB 499]|uniref:aminopeptidase N n=1 Tax=Actinomadura sp. WMMB 499 TaxID=1219491 RepID=UPI0012439E7B|nr:aminopeptidase N [Actinomadura sp. WMMB 499]QFG21183.1 aminopeptidase N [Actinomadura sp. WMMB 499]